MDTKMDVNTGAQARADSKLGPPPLRRSRRERLLFGVCGGIGEYFGIDPVLVRVAFVLVSLAGGAGILTYLILALLLPDEASQSLADRERLRRNLEDLQGEAGDLAGELRANLPGSVSGWAGRGRGQEMIALVLVAIGLLFLLGNFGAFSWFHWSLFWPVLLVLLGLGILVKRRP